MIKCPQKTRFLKKLINKEKYQGLMLTIQETAAQFANTLLADLNHAASQIAGVDIMWFRAIPDKRSQDVIFQSYTLYGVEDCPLEFKAIYNDTNYDDAAITYNIMGLSYAVPMTLDVDITTWKNVTDNDGTIPKQHDIIFIPFSRKLLEVVSMQPTKTLGAQLTTYKVNLEVYKPTRNRLVGENLQESINQNTTNLQDRFGTEIDDTLKNIVDDNQLSIYNSTIKDKQKEIVATISENSGIFDIRMISEYNLIVDGHNVARSYYNLGKEYGTVVKYKNGDIFDSTTDNRYYSCWVRPKSIVTKNVIKNIKDIITYTSDASYGYINLKLGTRFRTGDNVVFKRGKIIVPGYVSSTNKIRINLDVANTMSRMSTNWYNLPGFAVVSDNIINLLSGDNFSIDIKAGNYISYNYKGNEQIVLLTNEIKDEYWYGIALNIGTKLDVDIFSKDDSLHKIVELHDIQNKVLNNMNIGNFSLSSSNADITNIRLYDIANRELDKQITDLVSYNVKNNSHCIINDGADIYLNKPYIGRQR